MCDACVCVCVCVFVCVKYICEYLFDDQRVHGHYATVAFRLSFYKYPPTTTLIVNKRTTT
jgi:hypothetical protein